MKRFRLLILATFLLIGCKTYLDEVELKQLVTGKVKASQLSDKAICKILQSADIPSVTRQMWYRGINCRKSAQPLVSWELPDLDENFTIKREYQKNYNVIIPEYNIKPRKFVYGNPKQSLEYYNYFNSDFEKVLLESEYTGWWDNFCEKWILDLEWIVPNQTMGIDGSYAFLETTEPDAFTFCQHTIQKLSLKALINEQNSKKFQNIIERWIKNNTPKNKNNGEFNFLYVYWMNSVFNGVELLHQNFNWNETQYKNYEKWLRTRTLELFPIESKYKRSAFQCNKNIRDGEGGNDRSDECQNSGALTAVATLRAGIWLGDTKFIDQAYLTFHKYMTGIRKDGSNIADSSRMCAAANYNIWGSKNMSDFVYLWSIIGDSLWNHISLGMGNPSESVRYSLELIKNPEMINPYTEQGGETSDCSKTKINRKQNQLKARYPKIFWAPYFFQEESVSLEKFVREINYVENWDYLYNGSNTEISYLYHHPKIARKAENIYVSLKGEKIKDNTELIDNGLKNKKRGILKKYETIIQLYALHKDNEYKYPIFIAIKKNNFIDILLPRFSIKSGDPWNLKKNKIKSCNKKSITDDSYIINFNQISNETEIKCILNSFTFEERNIFLRAFEELINNAKIIFQNSIKESNDEHEKELLKKSLNWIKSNQFIIPIN
tara:strand:+ start:121 stop:2109 length:1989 start_codon:yes stop_codon:yes gene_type:complete